MQTGPSTAPLLPYEPGRVVWGQFRKEWWPARLARTIQAPEPVLRAAKFHHRLVHWFDGWGQGGRKQEGENEETKPEEWQYSWLPAAKLRDFAAHFDTYSRTKQTKTFRAALRAAISIADGFIPPEGWEGAQATESEQGSDSDDEDEEAVFVDMDEEEEEEGNTRDPPRSLSPSWSVSSSSPPTTLKVRKRKSSADGDNPDLCMTGIAFRKNQCAFVASWYVPKSMTLMPEKDRGQQIYVGGSSSLRDVFDQRRAFIRSKVGNEVAAQIFRREECRWARGRAARPQHHDRREFKEEEDEEEEEEEDEEEDEEESDGEEEERVATESRQVEEEEGGHGGQHAFCTYGIYFCEKSRLYRTSWKIPPCLKVPDSGRHLSTGSAADLKSAFRKRRECIRAKVGSKMAEQVFREEEVRWARRQAAKTGVIAGSVTCSAKGRNVGESWGSPKKTEDEDQNRASKEQEPADNMGFVGFGVGDSSSGLYFRAYVCVPAEFQTQKNLPRQLTVKGKFETREEACIARRQFIRQAFGKKDAEEFLRAEEQRWIAIAKNASEGRNGKEEEKKQGGRQEQDIPCWTGVQKRDPCRFRAYVTPLTEHRHLYGGDPRMKIVGLFDTPWEAYRARTAFLENLMGKEEAAILLRVEEARAATASKKRGRKPHLDKTHSSQHDVTAPSTGQDPRWPANASAKQLCMIGIRRTRNREESYTSHVCVPVSMASCLPGQPSQMHVGTFPTVQEAYDARRQCVIERFGRPFADKMFSLYNGQTSHEQEISMVAGRVEEERWLAKNSHTDQKRKSHKQKGKLVPRKSFKEMLGEEEQELAQCSANGFASESRPAGRDTSRQAEAGTAPGSENASAMEGEREASTGQVGAGRDRQVQARDGGPTVGLPHTEGGASDSASDSGQEGGGIGCVKVKTEEGAGSEAGAGQGVQEATSEVRVKIEEEEEEEATMVLVLPGGSSVKWTERDSRIGGRSGAADPRQWEHETWRENGEGCNLSRGSGSGSSPSQCVPQKRAAFVDFWALIAEGDEDGAHGPTVKREKLDDTATRGEGGADDDVM